MTDGNRDKIIAEAFVPAGNRIFGSTVTGGTISPQWHTIPTIDRVEHRYFLSFIRQSIHFHLFQVEVHGESGAPNGSQAIATCISMLPADPNLHVYMTG